MLGACIALAQESLPQGWRRPTKSEASSEWRQKSPNRYFRVSADFDGDGKIDTAELLINPATKQFAPFVKLAATQRWEMIEKPYELQVLDRFGINLVKPGKYETACGKGYGDYACAHGEPKVLRLTNPAIDLFYTESSDSTFYWDGKDKAFRKVLMSD